LKKNENITIRERKILIMASSLTCYICLDDIKKNKISMGCVCKGSIGVHRSCFSKWIKSTQDPFSCPVCKTGYSGLFMKQFFREDEIFCFGEEEEYYEEYEEYILHSVPVLFDSEGIIYFANQTHETIYSNSVKKELSGIRSCQNAYKKNKNKIKMRPISRKTQFRFRK